MKLTDPIYHATKRLSPSDLFLIIGVLAILTVAWWVDVRLGLAGTGVVLVAVGVLLGIVERGTDRPST